MSFAFLNREDAPFQESLWNLLDETVRQEASNLLTARRLLQVEGPFGLEMKVIPHSDQVLDDEADERVTVAAAQAIPLALISAHFRLSSRDIALYEKTGVRFDLEPVISSAAAIAAKEDKLILYGSESLGISGLLNAQGTQTSSLRSWNSPGEALEDVLSAIGKLQSSGFPGPYALALSPTLYRKLFRLYPQTSLTELSHIGMAITDGIVNASSLSTGGVVVATGSQFASISVGQDIMVGFEGPSDRDYVFTVSETVALRLMIPESVCVLQTGA